MVKGIISSNEIIIIFVIGIFCFLPLHCLPNRKKENIRRILETCLSTIICSAEQKSFWRGKIAISQKRQDQLDPYLASFYNTYSLASNYTQPYQDITGPAPERVEFKVLPRFIAEGEEDQVQVGVFLYLMSIKIMNFRLKFFFTQSNLLHFIFGKTSPKKGITWT